MFRWALLGFIGDLSSSSVPTPNSPCFLALRGRAGFPISALHSSLSYLAQPEQERFASPP